MHLSPEHRRALGIALTWTVAGGAWILVSDLLVQVLDLESSFPDVQTWKGLGFILVGSGVIYGLLYRELVRLRTSEQRIRTHARMLEEVGQAVVATDPDGRITFWNPAAEKLFGWRAEEVAGRSVLDVTVPPGDEAEAARILRSLRRDEAWSDEFRLLRRDGSTFPAIVSDSVLHGGRGEIEGYVGVTTDLSALKAAERELAESQERFRAIIEFTSEVTSVLKHDGTIAYISPGVERILGRMPAAEGLGDVNIHPEDRDAVLEAFDQVRREPEATVTVQARIRRPDGSWLPMEHQARNLLENPAVRGVVVHSRDLTDRQELETRLRQAQKMEAVGQLAGGVAHDFNNILTSILGYADILEAEALVAEEGREDLAEIRRSAHRASQLTRQLLAFSRQQVLRPALHDVNSIVEELRGLLRRLIGEDVDLRFETWGEPLVVRVDAGQLEQVVVNLVVNARDALDGGGTIRVVTEPWHPGRPAPTGDAPADGEWVVIAVVDDGAGLLPEAQERLFEPFFTTKAPGRGTGLGLSTVYGIVSQSGGSVTVDSERGRGTTFAVWLPRLHGTVPTAPSGRQDPAMEARPATVLVVEDDETVRSVARRALERAGHEVLTASTGEEALAVMSNGRPVELVVTDLVMPDMGGRELAERLGGLRPGLPVLFMSGYTSDRAEREEIAGAGSRFLQKPFPPGELVRRVGEVMAERPASP